MARTPKKSESTDSAADTPDLSRFEASMSELETLVEQLETGDVSLEDALARFERGVTLSRECQTLLKNAELRVDQLLTDGQGNEKTAPFTLDGQDAAE